MLGAIIGDIVGSIYEFHNTKDYDFPILGSDSNYTDDTVMSVAVADWLLADAACGTDTLAATMRRYGRDYPCPMGGYGGMFRRWLADPSMLVSAQAAKKVWERFGIGDRMDWSIVGGHGHCQLPERQFPEVQAFIDRFLLGRDVATGNVHRFELK